jgi:hypothetical protein
MKKAIALLIGALGATPVTSQQAENAPLRDRLLGARHAAHGTNIKMFVPAGSVRLIGWDRDSVVVRGEIARGEKFHMVPGPNGLKVVIDDHIDATPVRPCRLVLYVPTSSTISLKTVSADIAGSDVSGWFYTVSGAVRLNGAARSIEIEDMNGDVDLDAAVPWAHVRTGDGRLVIRGAPQDVDAATIAGALDIQDAGIVRGQFGSVSGDIRFAGTPPRDGIFDFSNHTGSVDLLLSRPVSGVFTLSSILGPIENGLTDLRPAASNGGGSGRPHSLRLVLGRGDAQVTVRNFKGPIRLRSK